MAAAKTTNTSSLFTKLLKKAKASFDAAKETSKQDGRIKIDKGNYPCRLTGIRGVKVGKTAKFIYEWKVLKGDQKGEMIPIWRGIEDQEWIYHLRDLRALGVDVDEMEIEDLMTEQNKLLKNKTKAQIQVTESGDYMNGSVFKLLKDGEDPDNEENEEDEEDEDQDEEESEDEDEEEEEEEEEEKPKKKKKTTKKDEDEDDDDDDDEEDVDEEDEEEEEEEEEKPKTKAGGKGGKKKTAAAEEEDDEDEDEDEEYEPEPGDPVTFYDPKSKERKEGIFRAENVNGDYVFREIGTKKQFEIAKAKAKVKKDE